jgi:ribosome-associated heat shock protein Hsp15
MTRTCLNPSGNPRMPGNLEIDNRTRLDKWLWAARFFKTRALASQAVNGGKVHLDGQRVKSSRQVRIDDCYEILRGQDRLEVIVRELGERRGSAVQAQLLYLETPSSIDRRARESEQRKLAAMQKPVSEHRPNKQERRKIRQFSGKL